MADFNNFAIHRVRLSDNRLHVVGQRVVFRAPTAILSVETGPDGDIYFSYPHSIRHLVQQ